MLYFHLNTDNFVDPQLNGEEKNIGNIELGFFNDVFSSLSDAPCQVSIWTEYPPFADMPAFKGKKWLLIAIDDESVKTSAEDLLLLLEKAHFMRIKHIGKSLKEMGLHYDYVIRISNEEVNWAWMDYIAENNLQNIEESTGNRNMNLPEK